MFILAIRVISSVGNRLKFHDRSSIVPNQPMIDDLSIKDGRHMISDVCLQRWPMYCKMYIQSFK